MQRTTQHHFRDIPAKDAQPESNYEERSDKPNLRTILQNIWHVIFQSVKVMRVKNFSRLKEIKEIMKTNVSILICWQRNSRLRKSKPFALCLKFSIDLRLFQNLKCILKIKAVNIKRFI